MKKVDLVEIDAIFCAMLAYLEGDNPHGFREAMERWYPDGPPAGLTDGGLKTVIETARERL